MSSAHSLRKVAESEDALKHEEMTEQKICAIQTMSIIVVGKQSFCFNNLLMSPASNESVRAKVHSFSNSTAFRDFVSMQKKFITPKGELGWIKKSQFQRLAAKDEFGLKVFLSRKKRWVIISLPLNWLFLLRNVL
jgi:hypothetical protein